MFHRPNNGAIEPQDFKEVKKQQAAQEQRKNTAMQQTATRRFASPQDGVPQQNSFVNQNSTAFFAVQSNNETNQLKEVEPMNNPQPQDKDQSTQNAQPAMQPQARVDIPGNNFQRPGAQASRPAYPGAYPGAQANSNAGVYGQSNVDTGSKLVIGKGISMSGEIEACDHLIVEGTIEAALKGASILDVAQSGAFLGTVEIEEANIAGRFEGDITVRGRLTIESTGTVIGSVSYKELSMEAGATLDGSISPIGSANAGAKKTNSAAPKARKVNQNNGAELPFADREAAE